MELEIVPNLTRRDLICLCKASDNALDEATEIVIPHLKPILTDNELALLRKTLNSQRPAYRKVWVSANRKANYLAYKHARFLDIPVCLPVCLLRDVYEVEGLETPEDGWKCANCQKPVEQRSTEEAKKEKTSASEAFQVVFEGLLKLNNTNWKMSKISTILPALCSNCDTLLHSLHEMYIDFMEQTSTGSPVQQLIGSSILWNVTSTSEPVMARKKLWTVPAQNRKRVQTRPEKQLRLKLKRLSPVDVPCNIAIKNDQVINQAGSYGVSENSDNDNDPVFSDGQYDNDEPKSVPVPVPRQKRKRARLSRLVRLNLLKTMKLKEIRPVVEQCQNPISKDQIIRQTDTSNDIDMADNEPASNDDQCDKDKDHSVEHQQDEFSNLIVISSVKSLQPSPRRSIRARKKTKSKMKPGDPDTDDGAVDFYEIPKQYENKIHVEENPDLNCPHCDTICVSRSSYVRHVRWHSDPEIPCPYCGDKLRGSWFLRTHIRHMHRNNKLDVKDVRPFACPYKPCPTAYRAKSHTNLRKHVYDYHPEHSHLPFACDICPKAYSEQNSLDKHKLIRHSSHPCDQCSKVFGLKSSLASHVAAVHVDESQYVNCEVCGRTFKSKTNLAAHLLTHQPDRKSEWLCDLCGKGFVREAHLQKHTKLTHAKIKEKICPHCGIGFGTSYVLKMHVMAKHEPNEGPGYPCSICGKVFKLKSYLYQHSISKVHGGPGLSRSKRRTRAKLENNDQQVHEAVVIQPEPEPAFGLEVEMNQFINSWGYVEQQQQC